MGTDQTVSTGGISKSAQDLRDLEVGTMVGEYKVEGLLGEGGMGRVYSATHPVIAKRAAIKILHPELSVNREAVERFVQEARSVNQIGHPNIVDIFSFGTLPDGRCYFVMEWLRGQSLRDRLRAGPLPIAESLAAIETVSIALEAAHEKGIVHRDLKPDNIFLVEVKGTAPTVKLLDFGIAKLLGNDPDRIEKTRTGNLLGTPAYISPEQARGQHVDHRTDIYALGALMYELLTGSLVFPAESAADMIAKHLYETPPDARSRNASIPEPLARLMMAMLAKDASARPTLEQVRGVVQPLRAGQLGIGGTPATQPMYTPQLPANTPPPGYSTGVPAQPTPAPPMQSVMGTSFGAPPQKSRVAIILVALVLAGGLGVAMFVALGGTKKDTPKPDPAPVTEPAVKLEPAVVPEPTIDTKPTETKPETTTTTETKPTETKTTDAKATDSKATDTKTADTKPTDTTPADAQPDTKKPTKKPRKPKKPIVVVDPDAPM